MDHAATTDDPEVYLRPGAYIDSDHPAVRAFAEVAVKGADDERAAARRLYVAVRDGIRYDPYVEYDRLDTYRASGCLTLGRGYCVGKAAVLAAAARAVGVPARIGFADVRNHLATGRLLALTGTDVFSYHGYTELFLGGRWVKATPTFDTGLCERFGVRPLDFDGENDALLHAFDRAGRRHMEYIRNHGVFADVPAEFLREDIRRNYPKLCAEPDREGGLFAEEASAETAE